MNPKDWQNLLILQSYDPACNNLPVLPVRARNRYSSYFTDTESTGKAVCPLNVP